MAIVRRYRRIVIVLMLIVIGFFLCVVNVLISLMDFVVKNV